MTLQDSFLRNHDYLRLAVTDRCNLRCQYCMPAEGIDYVPKKDLLSFEEMLKLCKLLGKNGLEKVRITGGEPFIRRNLIDFLAKLRHETSIEKIAITTNGVYTAQYIPQLLNLNIKDINLSLDSLNAQNFAKITRRNEFGKVMNTLELLIKNNFNVKINTVVMATENAYEIAEMVAFTEQNKVNWRFIEEMPFNGLHESNVKPIVYNHTKILKTIKATYPTIIALKTAKSETANEYQIPGFEGKIGIIAAYTRSFCGTCNRLRITAQGELLTCLYSNKGLNLKQMLRNGENDEDILNQITKTIMGKAKNGFEAEQISGHIHQSMTAIGG